MKPMHTKLTERTFLSQVVDSHLYWRRTSNYLHTFAAIKLELCPECTSHTRGHGLARVGFSSLT